MKTAALVMLTLMIIGCDAQITGMAVSHPEAKQMKVLFIVAQKDFRDEELSEPRKALEKAGHLTRVASITTDTAIGMMGSKVTPDLAIADANASDFDMVVVVGGKGAPELAKHPEVKALIQEFDSQQKFVTAICIGPTILAQAGVLKGKRATVYSTDEAIVQIEDAGAVYLNEAVVRDGRIITACGPTAARDFGSELVTVLNDKL
jgi:protease I